MKINAIKCEQCGDTIYRRARHDFRSCTCGEVSIDGGFDYLKICYNPKLPCPPSTQIDIEVTKEDLYKDWRTSADKFGLIKGDK